MFDRDDFAICIKGAFSRARIALSTLVIRQSSGRIPEAPSEHNCGCGFAAQVHAAAMYEPRISGGHRCVQDPSSVTMSIWKYEDVQRSFFEASSAGQDFYVVQQRACLGKIVGVVAGYLVGNSGEKRREHRS